MMLSMGQPSQGSFSEIAKAFSLKPGWCNERSVYSFSVAHSMWLWKHLQKVQRLAALVSICI